MNRQFKYVENETHVLIVFFRWIGDALKPQLTSLAAVVVSELEAEFEKVSKTKPDPIR